MGYSSSPDGRDARKFNSIILKLVIVLLHVGGIVVPGYLTIYAIWSDDDDIICSGSDTYPTDPILILYFLLILLILLFLLLPLLAQPTVAIQQ